MGRGTQLDRVEELLARDEIRAVVMRLARATDRRDPAEIRACYHPDAIDDHGAFKGTGAEFAEWVPATLAIFEATQHFLGNHDCLVTGDVATGETYCTAHHIFPGSDPGGARDSVMGLRYLDRFERRDGVWKIARRVCAYDYQYIVPFGERWPMEPDQGWTLGSPDSRDPVYVLHPGMGAAG